ncbi:hypothetical protein C3999_01799 [Escherichia marmotae]|nr:hypothetical protein C4A10_01840 [Escherichia marmotae]RDR63170.1 hypothetical protein C4A06_01972 [Escherichia marmotae]RDR81446.1 hypothetical protein C3999_01799 [Escherichia marmotae]RDR97649.1 hypothetical protein C3998_01818 [Escherichia marmotae]
MVVIQRTTSDFIKTAVPLRLCHPACRIRLFHHPAQGVVFQRYPAFAGEFNCYGKMVFVVREAVHPPARRPVRSHIRLFIKPPLPLMPRPAGNHRLPASKIIAEPVILAIAGRVLHHPGNPLNLFPAVGTGEARRVAVLCHQAIFIGELSHCHTGPVHHTGQLPVIVVTIFHQVTGTSSLHQFNMRKSFPRRGHCAVQ